MGDTLNKLFMGSIAYIEDEKKGLACDVHRFSHLEVQLMDSKDGDVIVQNGSESSLMNDVKAKQNNDLVLVELKKVVLEKSIHAFSQRG